MADKIVGISFELKQFPNLKEEWYDYDISPRTSEIPKDCATEEPALPAHRMLGGGAAAAPAAAAAVSGCATATPAASGGHRVLYYRNLGGGGGGEATTTVSHEPVTLYDVMKDTHSYYTEFQEIVELLGEKSSLSVF